MPDFAFLILIGIGLTLFEIVSSIDNAVINADVLSTMSKKGAWGFRDLHFEIFFDIILESSFCGLITSDILQLIQ